MTEFNPATMNPAAIILPNNLDNSSWVKLETNNNTIAMQKYIKYKTKYIKLSNKINKNNSK